MAWKGGAPDGRRERPVRAQELRADHTRDRWPIRSNIRYAVAVGLGMQPAG